MQPYVFPYIGYFQMIAAVDLFVLYDDVNFIKKGWINRNKILVNGKEYMFTVPCQKVSQNKLICKTEIAKDNEFDKLLKTLEFAYHDAPFFSTTVDLVTSILFPAPEYIHELASRSIIEISNYLGLKTEFVSSQDRYDNQHLKKAERLIDICHQEKRFNYINAIGGQALYSKDYFEQKGVSLNFLKVNNFSYNQLNHQFVPWLSIIDILMFNSKQKIVDEFLNNYELI